MNDKNVFSLLAAPRELYIDHINTAIRHWEFLAPRFQSSLTRVFRINHEEINELVKKVIRFHDLGKLTFQWQRNIREESKKKFPHASLGAAYLFKSQPEPNKYPMAFAVLIHHTDRGIVTDGLENPDVRALKSGLISNDETVRWADEVNILSEQEFPCDTRILSLYDLKKMARELRRWSRSGSFIEMHARRMEASLLHHILRICDVRAASERDVFDVQRYPFVNRLLYGGMNL